MKSKIYALLVLFLTNSILLSQWIPIGPPPGNLTIESLTNSGNNIFAGTDLYGVYLSPDNGQTWGQTALKDQSVYTLAISSNYIFAGTAPYGVYLSTNNGQNWTQRNEGLGNFPYVFSLLIASNFIFAGLENSSAYRRLLSDFEGVKIISNKIPEQFVLYQNYPNPFNPKTKIKFSIPQYNPPFTKGGLGGLTTLKVYNILAREVEVLVNQKLNPSTYEVEWNASNCPSGIYFCKMSVDGNFNETIKLILLK